MVKFLRNSLLVASCVPIMVPFVTGSASAMKRQAVARLQSNDRNDSNNNTHINNNNNRRVMVDRGEGRPGVLGFPLETIDPLPDGLANFIREHTSPEILKTMEKEHFSSYIRSQFSNCLNVDVDILNSAVNSDAVTALVAYGKELQTRENILRDIEDAIVIQKRGIARLDSIRLKWFAPPQKVDSLKENLQQQMLDYVVASNNMLVETNYAERLQKITWRTKFLKESNERFFKVIDEPKTDQR